MREEFQVHMLSDAGIAKATELGEIFSEALTKIEAIVGGPSREMSLAITHLQSAGFFAKRAIAIKTENQKPA